VTDHAGCERRPATQERSVKTEAVMREKARRIGELGRDGESQFRIGADSGSRDRTAR
jgi:hypothetical protein